MLAAKLLVPCIYLASFTWGKSKTLNNKKKIAKTIRVKKIW